MITETLRAQEATVMATVRKLRTAVGMSQQAFAVKLGLAVRTVWRWERSVAPKGKALAQLANLADQNNLPELAETFRDALSRDLLFDIRLQSVLLRNDEQQVLLETLDVLGKLSVEMRREDFERSRQNIIQLLSRLVDSITEEEEKTIKRIASRVKREGKK